MTSKGILGKLCNGKKSVKVLKYWWKRFQ